MSSSKYYTIEAHKYDRRYKLGSYLFSKQEYGPTSLGYMQEMLAWLRVNEFPPYKYRLELIETYVTRTNVMTGEEYQERYDTPYFCSPSSETYWSN